MLQQHNENDDLDDWEKYAEREYEEREEEREDETITFSVKLQSIKEKELKEEIERTNQQTVNDLFKVNNSSANKLPSIKNVTNASTNASTNAAIKTKGDYINYAKECSNKMKSNKATSISILTFCKTIVDENCLRISAEHLEDLLEHIHKLKESKLFKPINKAEQIKIQKQSQQNHKDIFGDCTENFEEEHLRIESKYA